MICAGTPGYATPERFALNPLVAFRAFNFNKPVDSMLGLVWRSCG